MKRKASKYIDSKGHEIVTFMPGTRDLYCTLCDKIYEKRNMQRLVNINGRFVAVARYYGYKNGRKSKTELLIKNGPMGRRWPIDVKRY